MKALITGVTGFVGANLAQHLLDRGWKVEGVARPESNLWRLSGIKEGISLHHGDLLDRDFVIRTLSASRPDAVFHLAVYGAYPRQTESDRILRTSILATSELLRASIDAGAKIFINTGSSSEYGTKDHPMRENEILEPNSYYAIGKAAQTHLCQYVAHAERFPVITLRLFSAYGPFEEPGRLVPEVVRSALIGRNITLADPRIARDFVYIEDIVRAYELASQKPELSGEVFNIGTGVQTTLEDFGNLVVKACDSRSSMMFGTYEKRSFDTYTWVADTKKAENMLGFRAAVSLEEGLRRCVPWFKAHAPDYERA